MFQNNSIFSKKIFMFPNNNYNKKIYIKFQFIFCNFQYIIILINLIFKKILLLLILK
jgi:hypothetical protein